MQPLPTLLNLTDKYNLFRFIFILQIHEGFRKIGVGVKDDLAIVTLSKAVDE